MKGSAGSTLSSLGLLHDLVAPEDREAVGEQGEEESNKSPEEAPSEHGNEVKDACDKHGAAGEATLSLVSVDKNGTGTLEDSENEDQPGKVGGWVNVTVESVHFKF